MAEKSITVEEVVAQALLLFAEEDSRDEMVFTEWAWQSLREVGPSNVDTFKACISVCDLSFSKPCGFISDIEINLLDGANNVVDHEQNLSLSLDSNGNFRGGSTMLSEQKDCYVLSDNDSAKRVQKMEIVYHGYPIDSEGEMLIEENLEKVIISYIEWKWTTRERRRRRNEIPMSEVQEMHKLYIYALKQAKANAKMVSPAAAKTIFRKWVSAIPNFQDKPNHKHRRLWK